MSSHLVTSQVYLERDRQTDMATERQRDREIERSGSTAATEKTSSSSVFDDDERTSERHSSSVFIVEKSVLLVVEDDVVDRLKVVLSDVVLLVGRYFDRKMVDSIIVLDRQCIVTL